MLARFFKNADHQISLVPSSQGDRVAAFPFLIIQLGASVPRGACGGISFSHKMISTVPRVSYLAFLFFSFFFRGTVLRNALDTGSTLQGKEEK